MAYIDPGFQLTTYWNDNVGVRGMIPARVTIIETEDVLNGLIKALRIT